MLLIIFEGKYAFFFIEPQSRRLMQYGGRRSALDIVPWDAWWCQEPWPICGSCPSASTVSGKKCSTLLHPFICYRLWGLSCRINILLFPAGSCLRICLWNTRAVRKGGQATHCCVLGNFSWPITTRGACSLAMSPSEFSQPIPGWGGHHHWHSLDAWCHGSRTQTQPTNPNTLKNCQDKQNSEINTADVSEDLGFSVLSH